MPIAATAVQLQLSNVPAFAVPTFAVQAVALAPLAVPAVCSTSASIDSSLLCQLLAEQQLQRQLLAVPAVYINKPIPPAGQSHVPQLKHHGCLCIPWA